MPAPSGPVVLLSGGTGGAELARGMLDVIGGERLTVIANTGDDIEIYGGYVSPDPDLVSFWLADLIDERGWGIDGDTFAVMDGLRALGKEVWFNLGDRDLAIALERARRLAEGASPTEFHAELGAALGVPATVLPATDRPLRTRVLAAGRWWKLQELMIQGRELTAVDAVEFRGARAAGTTDAVLAAIAEAQAIVIGPSNPAISIGPMLAIPPLREALERAAAPVVAVSPIVGGEVLKGPTALFMAAAGVSASAAGIAQLYDGLLDGLVTDEPVDGVATRICDLLMADAAGRRRLAADTLTFAQKLARARNE